MYIKDLISIDLSILKLLTKCSRNHRLEDNMIKNKMRKQITLQIQIKIVRGDRIMIHQMLENLIQWMGNMNKREDSHLME